MTIGFVPGTCRPSYYKCQCPDNACDLLLQSLETPLSLLFSTPTPTPTPTPTLYTVRVQKDIQHNDQRSRHPERQSWRQRFRASGKSIPHCKARQSSKHELAGLRNRYSMVQESWRL